MRLSLKERRMKSANAIKTYRKSGVAEGRDLRFYGPFLDMLLYLAQSLKKGALRRRLFALVKITQSDADQAKAMLQAQVDALPQCQRDGGQFF